MTINLSKKTLEYNAQGIWVTDWTGVPQLVQIETDEISDPLSEENIEKYRKRLKNAIKKFIEDQP